MFEFLCFGFGGDYSIPETVTRPETPPATAQDTGGTNKAHDNAARPQQDDYG